MSQGVTRVVSWEVLGRSVRMTGATCGGWGVAVQATGANEAGARGLFRGQGAGECTVGGSLGLHDGLRGGVAVRTTGAQRAGV